MLKKNLRFSFRKGAPKNKLINPLFVLRYQKSSTPTFGVVVSKIVSKKAVIRNRTKRMFLIVLQDLLIQQGLHYDLVFFLRRPYTEYSKSVIISELQEIAKKLKLNP